MSTNPPKTRILFIDDSSKRIHSALRRYNPDAGYEVIIAPNVSEALRLLSSEDWDVVSFDFDLDGGDFCNPDSPQCAMEILRYIQRAGWPNGKKVPEFLVHSSNAFGAELLKNQLISMVKRNFFNGQTHVVAMRYDYAEGEQ